MNEELKKPFVSVGNNMVNPDYLAPINPRVAAINAQVAASPLASQGISQAPSAITSASLQDVKPIDLPTTNSNTSLMAGAAIQGATEGLNTGIQGMISAEDKKIADYQTKVQTEQKNTQSLIDKLLGKGQAQIKAETEGGIPEKTQALTDITNEYNTKALEYRRMEEAVMKQGLLTDVQKNARLAEISRQKNTELADIGIKQSVAQNNLTTTQNLIDRKIDLEYGDLKDLITYQKGFLDNARADLTKEETNLFNLKIKENENAYNEGVRIGDFAKTVAANGAPADVISRVSSAKTMQEAIQAAGQYAGKKETQIVDVGGRKILIDSQTGQTIKTFGGEPINAAGLTPEQANDPFVSLLLKTKGGKPMTDTFAQKLDKGLTVLGQIGLIQENIKDVKTGPISGAFKGANPWDTNAQTIKAQLNAIVPNLARGVYGEVGVLTDNDIAQYSKTLPNLKSTEDIRNAVLGITVDLISKSIKRTLEVNAANGKDVSGFVDLYSEMQSTRDSIFSQIPGYNQKGIGEQFIIQVGNKQLDLASFEK